MLWGDPWGTPASNMDSNSKSEKSSFSSFFVVSKFGCELWRKWSFLPPLGLNFCIRSLKCSKFPRKPTKAQTAGQKYENFEKLTPELFKMSFFMKFKTSCALPPYYSTEPMKYALRVNLFWSPVLFLYFSLPIAYLKNLVRNHCKPAVNCQPSYCREDSPSSVYT